MFRMEESGLKPIESVYNLYRSEISFTQWLHLYILIMYSVIFYTENNLTEVSPGRWMMFLEWIVQLVVSLPRFPQNFTFLL